MGVRWLATALRKRTPQHPTPHTGRRPATRSTARGRNMDSQSVRDQLSVGRVLLSTTPSTRTGLRMPATSARTPFVFPCDPLRAMSSVAGQAIGRPLKVASPAAGSFRRSRLFVKDFYLIMSLVIATVVVYGFSHTVDQ